MRHCRGFHIFAAKKPAPGMPTGLLKHLIEVFICLHNLSVIIVKSENITYIMYMQYNNSGAFMMHVCRTMIIGDCRSGNMCRFLAIIL